MSKLTWLLSLVVLTATLQTAQAEEIDVADSPTKVKIVQLVKKVVEYMKVNGSEKTFAAISDIHGKFADGNVYVFSIDATGLGLANGMFPNMVGKKHIDDQDVDGTYYVKERLDLMKTKNSFWTSYKFPDPVTHKISPKISYCEVVHDRALKDILFCSGAFNVAP